MSELSAFSPVTTVEQLLAAAARHGLHVTSIDGTLDPTGLDFLVVHAVDADGTPWIVRTPRRPDVIESARVEARVLALVRPRVPVDVPHWRVHAPEVIAYPRIVGTPAISVGEAGHTWHVVDPVAPQPAFVDSFARALVALQAIAIEDARALDVPIRTFDEVRASLVRSADVAREILAPSDAVWARWQRWLGSDESWPRHLAMVHGDLHPGHLVLDNDARLLGILDWTEGQVTDPSIDLAMYFGCFGRAPLEALLERFVAHGGRTWPGIVEHAAERWAFGPAMGAEWAVKTNNPGVLEHVRSMLANI